MHMPSNATRVRMPFSNVFKPLTFHAAVNFDARAGRRQHVRCHGCSAREAGLPNAGTGQPAPTRVQHSVCLHRSPATDVVRDPRLVRSSVQV